jgi:hypothetical protein
MTTVAQAIAAAFTAILNCRRAGNKEWEIRWMVRLNSLCKNHLPSGSGFDDGVTLNLPASTPNRLVFLAPYHIMNEYGCYMHWVDCRVTVVPTFSGIDVTVRGAREHNEYIAEAMHEHLCATADMED